MYDFSQVRFLISDVYGSLYFLLFLNLYSQVYILWLYAIIIYLILRLFRYLSNLEIFVQNGKSIFILIHLIYFNQLFFSVRFGKLACQCYSSELLKSLFFSLYQFWVDILYKWCLKDHDVLAFMSRI